MITAIEIENFKGIGELQRIEFAPLTLLFGSNSSGKSTLIHALHYMREILESGNGDVDEIRATQGELRLGGFENLIHRHKVDRKIRIRVDLNATLETQFGDWFPNLEHNLGFGLREPLLKKPNTIGIQIEVSQESISEFNIAHPFIERLTLFMNGVMVVGSQATGVFDEFGLANLFGINLDHPSFSKIDNISVMKMIAERCNYDSQEFEFDPAEETLGTGSVYGATGALLTQVALNFAGSPDEFPVEQLEDENLEEFQSLQRSHRIQIFTKYFIKLIIGSTRYMIDVLNNIAHIGPIRDVPDRMLRNSFKSNQRSWYRGQAAWQCLLDDSPHGLMIYKFDALFWELDLDALVGSPYIIRRVETMIKRENWKALYETIWGKARNRELILEDVRTGTMVSLQDIGVGISQVIPVVVALKNMRLPVLYIEQPELHLHPKQQAMLGDVFIPKLLPGEIKRKKGSVIVETHSELLLLRLLKRIRELKESTPEINAPTFSANDLRIYAVENDGEGTKFRCLPISKSGDIVGGWPEGFFDERMDEVL